MSQTDEKPTILYVSYSQICVFDGKMENPFNCWTPRHVNQGFSWRDGSVSFKTLIESGQANIEFVQVKTFVPESSSMRTISVPFVCCDGARIEVATITESYPVLVDSGDYQLVYETGWTDSVCWCKFSMIANGNLDPRILVQDSEIVTTEDFLMKADPA